MKIDKDGADIILKYGRDTKCSSEKVTGSINLVNKRICYVLLIFAIHHQSFGGVFYITESLLTMIHRGSSIKNNENICMLDILHLIILDFFRSCNR